VYEGDRKRQRVSLKRERGKEGEAKERES